MNEARWEKLKNFIAEWHRPLVPSDGYSKEEIAKAEARLGIRFPEALREWYGFAGKWYYELQEHNYQYSLKEIELWYESAEIIKNRPWETEDDLQKCLEQQGGLMFHTENQGVCTWIIHKENLTQEDPPVYDLLSGLLYSNTLTEFLLSALIFETTCVLTEENTRGIAGDTIVPLLENHFRCWSESTTMGSFYGNEEALLLLTPDHGDPDDGCRMVLYGDVQGTYLVDLSLRSDEFSDHYKMLLASEVCWKS